MPLSRIKIFFLIPIFLLLQIAPAQAQLVKTERDERIHLIMHDFAKRENLGIDSVILFVNKHFKNNEDKVRAYYTFISLWVAYDLKRLNELKMLASVSSNDGELHHTLSQDPKEVFASKKGVCEGISRLMVRFCEGSGIKAEMVVGHCKTPEGEVVKDMGHAWNAVKLDSAWALLDITWSSGYVNEDGQFVKERSDKYFCLKPELFGNDHLPLDPMWQLCLKPVSKDWFFNNDSTEGKYYCSYFNFNDSISSYYKKTEFEKNYSSLLHYCRFDRKNQELARNLDIYINNQTVNKMNIAGIYNDEFFSFYNSRLKNNCSKANCKKAMDILANAQSNLKQAQMILKGKKAMTQEFDVIFKKLNSDLKTNSEGINHNIALLKKIQQQAK
jgi:hypothetical protein